MFEPGYTSIRKSHMPVTKWRKRLAKDVIEEMFASGDHRAKGGAKGGFRVFYSSCCAVVTGNQEVPLAVTSPDRETLISRLLPVWGSTIL
jgi:hypothetical protein